MNGWPRLISQLIVTQEMPLSSEIASSARKEKNASSGAKSDDAFIVSG